MVGYRVLKDILKIAKEQNLTNIAAGRRIFMKVNTAYKS
jgi:hypothetical protein